MYVLPKLFPFCQNLFLQYILYCNICHVLCHSCTQQYCKSLIIYLQINYFIKICSYFLQWRASLFQWLAWVFCQNILLFLFLSVLCIKRCDFYYILRIFVLTSCKKEKKCSRRHLFRGESKLDIWELEGTVQRR